MKSVEFGFVPELQIFFRKKNETGLRKSRIHEISANREIWRPLLANVRVFSAHQEIMANKKSN
jgi:hypothetical protein